MPQEGEDIIEGELPTPIDFYWIGVGKELIKGSSDTLDSAAKTLITLITTLITIYSAALTYFGGATQISESPYFSLLAIPPLVLLVAILQFTRVILPKGTSIQLDQPDSIKLAVKAINEEKAQYFTYGRYAFVLALLLMVVCIMFASAGNDPNKDTSAATPAQFVVKEANRPLFEAMSIPFIGTSTKTVPLTITKESDSDYTVKVNGTQILVDKKTVFGVVYVQPDLSPLS